MRERFLRSVRLLAECYQAFEQVSGRHVRELGLTPAQFDILATLGRTQGMSCHELGERTLITKGTLTGVLDRLEARGLLARIPNEQDRRSILVKLTPQGEAIFEQVFPAHIAHMKKRFGGYDPGAFDALDEHLGRLRCALQSDPDERVPAAPTRAPGKDVT